MSLLDLLEEENELILDVKYLETHKVKCKDERKRRTAMIPEYKTRLKNTKEKILICMAEEYERRKMENKNSED